MKQPATPQPEQIPLADGTHPAATWARGESFDDTRVNCTTTVVLKILDGKCKMLPGEKAAVVAIYQEIRRDTALFDQTVHQHIDHALSEAPDALIHRLRLEAEDAIPKPVMKRYKAFLRDGLFG